MGNNNILSINELNYQPLQDFREKWTGMMLGKEASYYRPLKNVSIRCHYKNRMYNILPEDLCCEDHNLFEGYADQMVCELCEIGFDLAVYMGEEG